MRTTILTKSQSPPPERYSNPSPVPQTSTQGETEVRTVSPCCVRADEEVRREKGLGVGDGGDGVIRFKLVVETEVREPPPRRSA